MARTVGRLGAGAWLLGAAAATADGATASRGDHPFWTFDLGGREVRGFVVRADPELGRHRIIQDDGSWASVAVDSEPVSCEVRPVDGMSPRALGVGLTDEDPWVQASSRDLLRELGTTGVREASKLLSHPSASVVRLALEVVMLHPGIASSGEVRRLLDHSDPLVRHRALTLMGRIEPSSSAALAWAVLRKERSPLVRHACVQLAGNSGSLDAVEVLIDIVARDEAASTRRCALQGLRRLTGSDLGVEARHWRNWWRQEEDNLRRQRKVPTASERVGSNPESPPGR